MANILIIYSTTDGHTRRICEHIKRVAENRDHKIELAAIDDKLELDTKPFDKIVIGASIRYGKHSPLVYDFVRRNKAKLESMPNAFFSVNVIARKPEKSQPENNPYLQKFLKRVSWQPQKTAVFAGKIDYPLYTFWDRQVIRLIMWMTGGPTDPRSVVDFTDWNKVDDFGRSIAEM
ncbi:MAG: menaquinone-dependent protoporphyrinogen IX dehydrogenase [Halocynthiibacter sp.]